MEELLNKFFKNITNPIVVLAVLAVLYFPLSFLRARFFPSDQNTLVYNSSSQNINVAKSTPQEFLISNYGLLTTNALVDAVQYTDKLINYLKVYPRIADKDINVLNDAKDFFNKNSELYMSVNPLSLKDWWQGTYYVFASTLSSQADIVNKIDISKSEINSEYKRQLISSLELNKSYISHISILVSNYVTLDYPNPYANYPDKILNEVFVGLPSFNNAADYSYFGFPVDVNHDGFLETVFYTKDGDLQKGYLVKNKLIVFESNPCRGLKILPLSNSTQDGFIISEEESGKSLPKLTRFIFKDGIYKQVN